MSDPTARRGDIITALLEEMHRSKKGWSKKQVLDFLFARYRFGVRQETLESIFGQLKDRGILYARPVQKGSANLVWFVDIETVERLTGAHIRS